MFDLNERQLKRRRFLQIGGLGLGGLSLPFLTAGEAFGASGRPVTGKSVIFLYQQGGPSQFETFDPKMDAPSEIRSIGGELKTTIPGVTFSSYLPKLAQHAHRMAVVRSYSSGNGGHGNVEPLVSEATLATNLGSLYSRVRGVLDPSSGMPTNAALFPNAIDAEAHGAKDRQFGNVHSGGLLGSGFDAFVPGGDGPFLDNLRIALPTDRFHNRNQLLRELDNAKRSVDEAAFADKRKRAYEMILGGVNDAFDITQEDSKTIARYDTSHLDNSKLLTAKGYKDVWRYTENAQTLGKLLLLARRLCEAGCGFVSVNTAFVWDFHEGNFNPNIELGMNVVAPVFDHAVSAFIEDCESRGLTDDILLVCTGEMGRTPRINKKGGRDHWGSLTPLMLYGGGLTGGQVVGESDRQGGKPATAPLGPDNLRSTIAHTLYDFGQLRLMTGLSNDVRQAIARMEQTPGVL